MQGLEGASFGVRLSLSFFFPLPWDQGADPDLPCSPLRFESTVALEPSSLRLRLHSPVPWHDTSPFPSLSFVLSSASRVSISRLLPSLPFLLASIPRFPQCNPPLYLLFPPALFSSFTISTPSPYGTESACAFGIVLPLSSTIDCFRSAALFFIFDELDAFNLRKLATVMIPYQSQQHRLQTHQLQLLLRLSEVRRKG
jgi:hypothetical protein